MERSNDSRGKWNGFCAIKERIRGKTDRMWEKNGTVAQNESKVNYRMIQGKQRKKGKDRE